MSSKAKAFFIVLLAAVNGCLGCTDPWVEIQGACYAFFGNESHTWDTSSTFCKDQGGTLAHIKTADLLKAIDDTINSFAVQETFWIGGSDIYAEGDWRWEDFSRIERGTPFWSIYRGAVNWHLEPSGGTSQNCLALDSERCFYFDDLNCYSLHHPLCMKPT